MKALNTPMIHLAAPAVILLASCAWVVVAGAAPPGTATPVDVTRRAFEDLKVGLTPEEVREILGVAPDFVRPCEQGTQTEHIYLRETVIKDRLSFVSLFYSAVEGGQDFNRLARIEYRTPLLEPEEEASDGTDTQEEAPARS